MSHRWAANTEFREVTLEVTERTCPKCQHRRVIESRRKRRIFTCEGPVHLTCQLCRCSNPDCPDHKTLVSPEAEMRLVLPYCVLGWDVLCWLGHRRFARHWSVPQIRQELKDRFEIPLSEDAIEEYVFRYQGMIAAGQQDPEEFKRAYQGVKGVALSIDGLQPEKGHETLYVVREIGQNRVWFAVALLSSTEAEIKQVLMRAREMVEQLGLPVQCWVSDKQKAFVTGIAEVFKGCRTATARTTVCGIWPSQCWRMTATRRCRCVRRFGGCVRSSTRWRLRKPQLLRPQLRPKWLLLKRLRSPQLRPKRLLLKRRSP